MGLSIASIFITKLESIISKKHNPFSNKSSIEISVMLLKSDNSIEAFYVFKKDPNTFFNTPP